jgi:hypothetical protein
MHLVFALPSTLTGALSCFSSSDPQVQLSHLIQHQGLDMHYVFGFPLSVPLPNALGLLGVCSMSSPFMVPIMTTIAIIYFCHTNMTLCFCFYPVFARENMNDSVLKTSLKFVVYSTLTSDGSQDAAGYHRIYLYRQPGGRFGYSGAGFLVMEHLIETMEVCV